MRCRSIYQEHCDQSSRYEGSKDADFRTAIEQEGREGIGSKASFQEERAEDYDGVDNTASKADSQTEAKDCISSDPIGRQNGSDVLVFLVFDCFAQQTRYSCKAVNSFKKRSP